MKNVSVCVLSGRAPYMELRS